MVKLTQNGVTERHQAQNQEFLFLRRITPIVAGCN